jgi:hypothetical protein
MHALEDPTFLSLKDSPLATAGLQSLRALLKLRVLELGRTGITDDGLEHLQGLQAL